MHSQGIIPSGKSSFNLPVCLGASLMAPCVFKTLILHACLQYLAKFFMVKYSILLINTHINTDSTLSLILGTELVLRKDFIELNH